MKQHNAAAAVGPRFIPVTKWSNFHPWPSHDAWRWVIRLKRDAEAIPHNQAGMAACVLFRNGRWVVDEQRFVEHMRDPDGQAA